jgi:two-component system, sensor histidine kinase LadS
LYQKYLIMSKIFSDHLSQKQVEAMFHDDEKCLEFLANLKWSKGFVCKNCGNTNYCAGKEPFSRRCTKCKHKETATNGTIFHGVKFPISKAFYIAYNVCKAKEDISTYEFARRLSLRQMTCWNFKTKIQNALIEIKTLSEKERSSIENILTS